MSGSSKKRCCCVEAVECPSCEGCAPITVAVDNVRFKSRHPLPENQVTCDTGPVSYIADQFGTGTCTYIIRAGQTIFEMFCGGQFFRVFLKSCGHMAPPELQPALGCNLLGVVPVATARTYMCIRNVSFNLVKTAEYQAPFSGGCPPVGPLPFAQFQGLGTVEIIDPGTMTIS